MFWESNWKDLSRVIIYILYKNVDANWLVSYCISIGKLASLFFNILDQTKEKLFKNSKSSFKRLKRYIWAFGKFL